MPSLGLRPPLEEVDGIVTFLEAEGIVRGARLLDAPCGIGRRALGLAEAGFSVMAVDSNEIGIAAAKARVPHGLESRLSFLATPLDAMPGLGTEQRFDAILCLDHPLGRGPPEDDVAFLTRLATNVGDGGCLVVELLHRDFFGGRQRPFSFHTIGTVEQHEFRSFDPVTGVLHIRWKFYERVAESLKHRTDSKVDLTLLTPPDLAAMLERAGWHMSGVWGGWAREPLSADHRKLVALARPAH